MGFQTFALGYTGFHTGEVVWAWPVSLREIGSLGNNVQLSRNNEYI